MDELLEEAFALVGRSIKLAHCKDLDHDGDAGHVPAGQGRLDYPHYLQLLYASGYDSGLILHGLSAQDVPLCSAAVRTAAPAHWV